MHLVVGGLERFQQRDERGRGWKIEISSERSNNAGLCDHAIHTDVCACARTSEALSVLQLVCEKFQI